MREDDGVACARGLVNAIIGTLALLVLAGVLWAVLVMFG
jgi:hypothetical protein